MKTKKITQIAILLALMVIGSNIRFLGSIALDSFPAFLGTILLGNVSGIILGVIGHLISALLSGFPQTFPLHILIAVMMGVTMYIFGVIGEKTGSRILSCVVAYLVNVVVQLMIMTPILSLPVTASLFVPLSLATIVNLILTELVYAGLPQSYIEKIMS